MLLATLVLPPGIGRAVEVEDTNVFRRVTVSEDAEVAYFSYFARYSGRGVLVSYSIPEGTGTVHAPSCEDSWSWPEISGDGTHLLFLNDKFDGDVYSEKRVMVMDTASGEISTVARLREGILYSPVFIGDNLIAYAAKPKESPKTTFHVIQMEERDNELGFSGYLTSNMIAFGKISQILKWKENKFLVLATSIDQNLVMNNLILNHPDVYHLSEYFLYEYGMPNDQLSYLNLNTIIETFAKGSADILDGLQQIQAINDKTILVQLLGTGSFLGGDIYKYDVDLKTFDLLIRTDRWIYDFMSWNRTENYIYIESQDIIRNTEILRRDTRVVLGHRGNETDITARLMEIIARSDAELDC